MCPNYMYHTCMAWVRAHHHLVEAEGPVRAAPRAGGGEQGRKANRVDGVATLLSHPQTLLT